MKLSGGVTAFFLGIRFDILHILDLKDHRIHLLPFWHHLHELQSISEQYRVLRFHLIQKRIIKLLWAKGESRNSSFGICLPWYAHVTPWDTIGMQWDTEWTLLCGSTCKVFPTTRFNQNLGDNIPHSIKFNKNQCGTK